MKQKKIKILLALIFTIAVSVVNGQTCGFGCLGLSGAYAGYSFNRIDTPGLNEAVNNLMNGRFAGEEYNLKNISGFRFGANIFRAKFDNYFFSAKGYYQLLEDKTEYSASVQAGLIKDSYQFSMNNWGIGLDFGIPLFSFLDLKIVEGGINFYSVSFKTETFLNGSRQSSYNYENNQTEIGYYAGTGFILHIIHDYLSLESTATYNFFNLEQIVYDKEKQFPENQTSGNFVEKAGFAASIQLNIGFPL